MCFGFETSKQNLHSVISQECWESYWGHPNAMDDDVGTFLTFLMLLPKEQKGANVPKEICQRLLNNSATNDITKNLGFLVLNIG